MNATTSPPYEKAVFRNLALPVSVFDYIKDIQRSREATHGNRLSIAQVVSQIIREHRDGYSRVPVLLASRAL